MRRSTRLPRNLNKITQRIIHIMKVDACGICLKNKSGKLIPRVYRGLSTKCADFLFSEKNLHALKGAGKTKAPSQIYNLCRYDGGDFKDFAKHERLKTFMTCPIFIRGKGIGMVIVCTTKKHRKFTKTEKLLFSTLVDEVAFVIRNEELVKRVKRDYLNTIKAIAHILEANDRYTYGHSNKVMKHAVNICKILELKKEDFYIIKNAALLHDIGKIGVDRKILNKEGKLTAYEWEEIKRHSTIGADIVGETGFLDELGPIIKHHHERYAGGGYPDPALKNGKIPIGAKIIAIADAYDAMTSKRPYRNKPLTMEMALAEIRKSAGKQFDPQLAKIFIDYMTKKVNPHNHST